MHRQALINSALFCAQEDLRGRICRFFAFARPYAGEKARDEWLGCISCNFVVHFLYVDKDLWCRCGIFPLKFPRFLEIGWHPTSSFAKFKIQILTVFAFIQWSLTLSTHRRDEKFKSQIAVFETLHCTLERDF